MSLGVGLVWISSGTTAFGVSLHSSLGWLVVLLGWMQLIGGYLRGSKGGPVQDGDGAYDDLPIQRGDHYHMTRRRVVFEWLHKLGGYATLLLSLLVTGLGLGLVNAPWWLSLTLALWWVILLFVAFKLQRAGRCIDTYQAIWGPDPRHPGNSREVIGWGVRRYTAKGSSK